MPRPPRFTPVTRAEKSLLNPDKRIAAGTLLMIWLVRIPVRSSLPCTAEMRNSLTYGIRFIFPINTKKHKNVKSKK